ncbi:MAG: hypothetical protein DGJ47_000219 [Rickettsiaceae bacterium]
MSFSYKININRNLEISVHDPKGEVIATNSIKLFSSYAKPFILSAFKGYAEYNRPMKRWEKANLHNNINICHQNLLQELYKHLSDKVTINKYIIDKFKSLEPLLTQEMEAEDLGIKNKSILANNIARKLSIKAQELDQIFFNQNNLLKQVIPPSDFDRQEIISKIDKKELNNLTNLAYLIIGVALKIDSNEQRSLEELIDLYNQAISDWEGSLEIYQQPIEPFIGENTNDTEEETSELAGEYVEELFI